MFNLITNPWIPVVTKAGPAIIRPDQIAENGVIRMDWFRADFNLACLELLIGLHYLADPPADPHDWMERAADAPRLKERLFALTRAFNFDGEGPRFLQDYEVLTGDPNPLDMLFIDSAGGNAVRKNADLMVHRARYPALSLPIAAMALYTLQAFAPSGGAGHRTSMRGGGPMVTLIAPPPEAESDTPLWSQIWANVPEGAPVPADGLSEALPWMRPTRTSEQKDQITPPPEGNRAAPEAFFGMPRRLRLEFGEGKCAVTGAEGRVATGVRQQTYGTNYGLWIHPLTPYYAQNAGSEKLPLHPKPGNFGYRNWIGIAFGRDSDTRFMADNVRRFQSDRRGEIARLQLGGWAMDNMKPLDFILSEQPLMVLSPDQEYLAVGMVEAAEAFSRALAGALQPVVGVRGAGASAISILQEVFFINTQTEFETMLGRVAKDEGVARDWLKVMRRTALGLFDERALAGLADRDSGDMRAIIKARDVLLAAFGGRTKAGKEAFTALGLDLPVRKKRKERVG